jgi:hypothetical protein
MEMVNNYETNLQKAEKNILGWGVDADKSVRPNYPMWKIPEQGTGAHWKVPEQQPNFRDFYSIERPGPTKVFGSSVPPSGLSGLVRKYAFKKYSESHWEHWLLLMFADRIGVFEGIVDDIKHGIRPRLLQERGWAVDKKFKTKRYKRVVGLSVVAVFAIPLFLLMNNKKGQV